VVRREQALDPRLPLGKVAVEIPETVERTRQLHGELRLTAGLEPVERSAQVVVLRLQPAEPWFGITFQVRVRVLGKRKIVRGIKPRQLLRLARLLEPLERELADRLEHPEALLRVADEALLDQRLEDVEIGLQHVF